MKAIRTRYYGPTDTKGSKIVATDSDGNRVSLSYDHALDSEGNHEAAARALMMKMQWSNDILGGEFAGDRYWTMQPREGSKLK